jgi:hypothetical protein
MSHISHERSHLFIIKFLLILHGIINASNIFSSFVEHSHCCRGYFELGAFFIYSFHENYFTFSNADLISL